MAFELPPEEDFIVTIDDCRRAGHCPRGIRAWFEKYGFDFRDVLHNGVSARAMLATGDGQGEQVVIRAWERRRHG